MKSYEVRKNKPSMGNFKPKNPREENQTKIVYALQATDLKILIYEFGPNYDTFMLKFMLRNKACSSREGCMDPQSMMAIDSMLKENSCSQERARQDYCIVCIY